jgi:uncharacterized cofD-like protein
MKHIVLFSGGTAARSLNFALCNPSNHITRIVPAWDSGGSSKVIRDKLSLLAVGDLRQALMAMAHGEGCAGDVVKICNARLSSNLGRNDVRNELLFYAEGRHPLLERLEPGLRAAILNYLKTFVSAVGNDFDFRNGSVGNFILTGACLAHNGDINTAIFVFRKLCNIRGDVWSSSTDNDLTLSATLNDGSSVKRQDLITKMSAHEANIGIKSVKLSTSEGKRASSNPAAIEAINGADLIVFGPGSFYTSLLPHLQVPGIADAIENSRCAKVLVSNILQCNETLSLTLRAVLAAVSDEWRRQERDTAFPFTHILANRVLFPFEKTVGAFPYLLDDVAQTTDATIVRSEFEDAWNRGQHDGDAVAEALSEILVS